MSQKGFIRSLTVEEQDEVLSKELIGSGKAFAGLLEESLQKRDIQEGKVVKGKVVAILKDFVVVDVGYKSEGQIRISEFTDYKGQPTCKVGDEVNVLLVRMEDENGMVILSKEKADMIEVWEAISQAAERDEIVEGTVIGMVKGGLAVDIGIKAFLPGSQIDVRPIRNLKDFIGKQYQFKVIKLNRKRGNIVLSRRILLEKERDQMRSQILETLVEGQRVKGVVKNITDYGAFIDLGGVDGLLHITDMSWGRVKDPRDFCELGQEVEVKILKYDREKNRVSLGMKQLTPDPWEDIQSQVAVGEKVKGTVLSLADYGAFVEIKEGIEGLIHISEMSWTQKIKHPSKILSAGQTVEAIVLDVDTENRRVSLGLKQLEENPWEILATRYPVGSKIAGVIRNVTDFGLFVSVEEGVDGLIHISDLSWDHKINPQDFKIGQEVKAMVLNIDQETEKFSLGLKQLEKDPWDQVKSKYSLGQKMDVKITRLSDFGVFVELEPGVEGLIHISEMGSQGKRGDEIKAELKEGDSLQAMIMSVSPSERKISLSLSALEAKSQKEALDAFQSKNASSKASLGDVLSSELEKKLRQKTETE